MKRSINHALSITEAGPIIAFLPTWLRPILGPLIARSGKNDCEFCIDMLEPMIKERIHRFNAKEKCPNDILQWAIEESAASGNPAQMVPRRIAHRLVVLDFNAAPPVGMTLANLISDLYSDPSSPSYVDELRKECSNALNATSEGYWTKDATSNLVLLDSTLRESMRLSSFGHFAFPRRVSTSHSRSSLHAHPTTR